MTNTYQYSIAVDKALEKYGAKTHGSLARRVERLKRFTDVQNKRYADEIRVEQAREAARQYHDHSRHQFLKALDERYQTATVPTYNLRSQNRGLNLLARAIENGFVNTRRG